MPRIENSQLGRPQEGSIQLIVVRPLNDSPALYLEIPIDHLNSLSERPRKYLRYLGWCIMGVEGHVARDSPQPEDDIGWCILGAEGHVARDSPQPEDDIGDEGGLQAGSVYSYQTAEGLYPCHQPLPHS